MVCWMVPNPLRPGASYAMKHTTQWCRAAIQDLRYRLDINTLHRDEDAPSLGLNDIGRIAIRATSPIMHDSYHRNRATGSFLLVDEATNVTAGAGMIVAAKGDT